MKNRWGIFLLVVSALPSWTQGCKTSPSPGVEIGNPSKSGTVLRVVPDEGDEAYQLTFLESGEALVERFVLSTDPEILSESILAPYRETDGRLSLAATFADRRTIGVVANFNNNGVIYSVDLSIDDREVSSCFEDRLRETRCRSRTVDDASTVRTTDERTVRDGDREPDREPERPR